MIRVLVLVMAAFAATPNLAGSPTIPVPTGCVARLGGTLPDPKCTPGAYNHAVTQATIHKTICVSGWASSVRPPVTYTEPLKSRLTHTSYNYAGSLRLYELDHLIPIELGGSPTSVKNLWPEPHDSLVNGKQEGSYVKDGFENSLNAKVCNGSMKLAAARKEMAKGTWIK